MTMPPITSDGEESRKYFSGLRQLLEKVNNDIANLHLSELSMGTSHADHPLRPDPALPGPRDPPVHVQVLLDRGHRATRGKYGLSVVQRDAEGNVVARSDDSEPSASNPFSRQIVYAGVKPPSPPRAGPSAVTIAGAVLVGLGVVLVGVLVFRSWRARRDEDREDEVQERLDEFKKQARDRSADSDP